MRKDYPELHRKVAFEKGNKQIIWQPRIGCWYDDKMFTGEGLPGKYKGMNPTQVYEELDVSSRLYDFNGCFRRIEHPQVKLTTKQLNETDYEHTIHTPVGNQTFINRVSKNSQHVITVKWEIVTDDDFKIATWREENSTWEFDWDHYNKTMKAVGHLGLPTMFMPRMNVQALYIEKMGVMDAVYAMFGKPQIVERFFNALEDNHDRLIDVINDCPVDVINFGENIHSGTLSPDLFIKYHLPACQRRCEKLHKADKFVHAHWDGDTKPLLKYAKETGLDGIEAITPKPQGDVTLEEVKEALGDDMFLIDGLPAVYFDETYSVETLVECTNKLIEMFAPKLILGISDEISSTGDIERIKIVRDIVDSYNESVK